MEVNGARRRWGGDIDGAQGRSKHPAHTAPPTSSSKHLPLPLPVTEFHLVKGLGWIFRDGV